jgi:hypothetical protein
VLKIRLIKWYIYYNKKRAYYKTNKEITNILNIIKLLLAFIIVLTLILTPRDIYKN